MTFTCRCCGQVHDGLADLVFAAPAFYYTVPESERERRCTLTADMCSIDDEDFFIRGCLEIPIKGSSQKFSWGVWCSVSRTNFAKYQEVFEDEHQSNVGPFFGWFSVRLPGYPNTLNLKVMAHLRDNRMRPLFDLEESDHPLSLDYRHGITMERLQEIYEANLHSA
jgi:hypothetical protein